MSQFRCQDLCAMLGSDLGSRPRFQEAAKKVAKNYVGGLDKMASEVAPSLPILKFDFIWDFMRFSILILKFGFGSPAWNTFSTNSTTPTFYLVCIC